MLSQKSELIRSSKWTRYGVAIGSVVVASLARQALSQGVGPTALPFIFFFPAVALSSLFGRLGPGLLSIVLSLLMADWFFMEPLHTFSLGSKYDAIALLAFLLAALLIVGSVEMSHRARARLMREIAQRRRAEAELKHLASIVEFSGDVIITKNLEGLIQSWNPAAERLFGYSAREVIGKPVTILFPPDRLKEEDHILDHLRKGQSTHRLETLRVAKDGRRIPVAVYVSPLRDAEGKLIGASKVIHDITDLAAARDALVREKELLATTLASIGDAVIVTDSHGKITFLNPAAERLTKWSNSEAAGRPLPHVFRIINEETRLPVEDPVEKVLRLGGVVGLANHTILIARDGTEIPIDDSAAPIRSAGDSLFGVVLVFRNVTEHRKAQHALQEAHEQLASRAVHLENLVQERTARLNEMVGDLEAFSYSIVHDMRAPLRAMQSFATLLEHECTSLTDSGANYLRRIKTAAERMDHLIQDGLSYSRIMRQDLPLLSTDLDALLRGIVESYPAFHPPHATIQIDGPLPLVRGNEAALTQCISNLLGNAVKFVAPDLNPHVRIWAEKRDHRVHLFFKDNGIGIEKDSFEKIFHIFQRLHPKYEGTGIGLAIVRKAAERMGGTVGLRSEPGKGSTFWLELDSAGDSNNETL